MFMTKTNRIDLLRVKRADTMVVVLLIFKTRNNTKHERLLVMKKLLQLFVLTVITCFIFTGIAKPIYSQNVNANGEIDKAFISFRIGCNIWMNPERFQELMDMFGRHPGVTDEITFFTQATHSPIKDEELIARCHILRERMKVVRSAGYHTGINILCTIGHHPEDMQNMIGEEFPRAMTISGQIAEGTLCMNTELFRERIRAIYKEMAKADPDYIWIDDDVRCGHWLNSAGNAGSTCYCDTCMEMMSDDFGEPMTREKLAERMNDNETRRKILQFNSDSITRLFRLIEKVVHDERPTLPLGFMTGERYEEGYDFTRWADTLAGPDHVSVMWRPGGGFYTQDPVNGMVSKSHDIGRQVSLLPQYVINIQSEIENFTYDRLAKSKHITALEAASHIAAGCTGAAFNVLTMNDEPLTDFEPLVETLARWRPFYDQLVASTKRKPTWGVAPLWKSNGWANTDSNPVNYFVPSFAEIGIPIAYNPEDSNVYLLTRGFLASATQDEVREILSHGVYTDNDAIGLLNSPLHFNVGNLVGFEFGDTVFVDGIEKYVPHKLNGNAAGMTRDIRQSFWKSPVIALRETNPNSETLSSLVNYDGKQTNKTTIGVFENEFGGRVCVNGYYPWEKFFSGPKSAQMKAIFRWLSHDELPAWIHSFHRAHLWVRGGQTKSEPMTLIVLNSTYDEAKEISLMVRTDSDTIMFCDTSCQKTVIKPTKTDGAYKLFTLPTIAAWDIAFVETSN